MTRSGQYRTSPQLEDSIFSIMTELGGLARGEVITHFDLVAETRYVDEVTGEERIRRHRWSPAGSSPHLSYGNLAAEACRVLKVNGSPDCC